MPTQSQSIRFGIAPLVTALLLALLALTANAQQSSTQSKPLQSLFKADKGAASTDDEYLKPDEAFAFSAEFTKANTVTLSWKIADGYYLYQERFKASTESTLVKVGELQFPQGENKTDDLGDHIVYHHQVDIPLPVTYAANTTGEFELKVKYQGCAEKGLCYLPMTKMVMLAVPDAATFTANTGASADGAIASSNGNNVGTGEVVSEQDQLALALQGDNVAYALLMFFLAGLGLSLTPCVLPMIPILSGIIVGQGEKISRKRSFSLAMIYVQGMALTYAAAGAVFALLFKQTPQAFFQQPWIIISMTLLFIALAFAMFGAYTLQMPSFLQTKFTDVSNKQKSGTLIGTFIMGALSALVVTACVAPAIVAALTVIIQSRQILRGALALYCAGIGMGIPLLIVGASAGDLLPRAGAWMDTVKHLFGVIFLGVGVYLIQPLLPDTVVMLLWAILATVSGYWLFSLTHGAKPASSVVHGFGVVILVYGIALLIGALAGRTDPLQPLAGISAGVSGDAKVASSAHSLPFKRIKSLDDLDREVAAANAAGKTVMLDFYADWCTSCKEMDKFTFTDARVQAALANTVLLQADVTQNDEIDQTLVKRFEILGPPSIMFFGTDAKERKNFRLVGYMKADKFHTHVTAAFAQ